MNGKVWTQEEIDILSRMYPDHFAKEIAGVLGRGVSSIYCKAEQLGLECSPEKIRRSGLMSCNHPNNVAARFTKGHHPSNKGEGYLIRTDRVKDPRTGKYYASYSLV